MDRVKIQALEKEGSRMTAGKVYAVSVQSSDILIKKGDAIKAKDSMKVGEVYDLPKSQKASEKKEASTGKNVFQKSVEGLKKAVDDITK